MPLEKILRHVLVLGVACVGLGACDRKEKLIDIKTPDGGITIERDKKSGEVEIEIE